MLKTTVRPLTGRVSGGGGGISDAPDDGHIYGRSNLAWFDLSTAIEITGVDPNAPPEGYQWVITQGYDQGQNGYWGYHVSPGTGDPYGSITPTEFWGGVDIWNCRWYGSDPDMSWSFTVGTASNTKYNDSDIITVTMSVKGVEYVFNVGWDDYSGKAMYKSNDMAVIGEFVTAAIAAGEGAYIGMNIS